MMGVKISPNPRQQYENANGIPYVGGRLFTYAAGSTTKQTTYTDSAGGTANTNPIILDSAGRTPFGMWLTEGLKYKFVLSPSTDTDPPTSPIFTEDGIAGVNDTATTTSQWIASGATPTYISATQFTLIGDKTADFHVGRRVKFTVTAGTVYGRISATAYTTLTTVTIVGGALDSGLSAVELSALTATNHAIPVLVAADLQAIGIQPLDATLTALAAQTTAANNVQAYSGPDAPLLLSTGTASGNIPLIGTKSSTELLAGLTELATQTEAEAGTDDTVVMTPLKTKQAIAVLAPLAKSYTSADQAITSGGSLTLAHGLGSIPKFLSVYLKCLTAEAGYSVGDIVQAPITNADSGGDSKGVSITVDATNLNIRIGSAVAVYNLLNKGTGTGGNITNANWNLIFRGWA